MSIIDKRLSKKYYFVGVEPDGTKVWESCDLPIDGPMTKVHTVVQGKHKLASPEWCAEFRERQSRSIPPSITKDMIDV